MTFSIKTEKMSMISPAIAEVKSSWPAFNLSGFPEEVIIWKPATTINRKAIPPPTPIAQRKIKATNWFVSLTGIQPMAVFISPSLGQPKVGLLLGTMGFVEQQTCPLASQVFLLINLLSPVRHSLYLQVPGQIAAIILSDVLGTQQLSPGPFPGAPLQSNFPTDCSEDSQFNLQVPSRAVHSGPAQIVLGEKINKTKKRAAAKNNFLIASKFSTKLIMSELV